MDRRQLIKAGLTAAATACLGNRAVSTASADRPNIVFIMADDMGYADISANSAGSIETPHIDGLARTGVNLRQAYAASAVCSASRLALITGRYHYRLRLGLEEPAVSPGIGLPAEHPTLPSLLRAAGYRTMLIGKWHLGGLPEFGPLKSGYDHFFGFRGGGLDYFTHLSGNGKPDLWEDDAPVTETGYLTNLIGTHAVKAIDDYAASGHNFFLSVHFNAPHWPWESPVDEAEAKRIGQAGFAPGTNDLNKPGLRHRDGGSRKTYEAMVKAMDDEVGRIVDRLKRHGLYDNTIVIFTSDNGGERFSNTWPFSGQKTELLEGGIRIPTLISWPRALPRNVVHEQVNIHMDWLPTLLAAAGAEPDAAHPSDGINLLPILQGKLPLQERRIYWRYKANHQRALRDGDYKFLQIAGNSYLFNVVADPLERANLKFREADKFAELATLWKQWNVSMLPELDETFTEGVLAVDQADHIGAEQTLTTADPGN